MQPASDHSPDRQSHRVSGKRQGRRKFAIPPNPNPDCSQCVKDGLEVVQRILQRYRPVALPALPRFTGGAVGFIGYEFIHDIEPVVPRPPHDELKTPTLYFLIADELLIFDRVAQTVTILVNAILDDHASPADAYEAAIGEIDRIIALLEQPSEHVPVTLPVEVPQLPFASNTPKEKFLANVLKAKTFITAGDIIQVVGSQRFSTPVKASPLDVYRAARSIILLHHVPARAGGIFPGRRFTGASCSVRGS